MGITAIILINLIAYLSYYLYKIKFENDIMKDLLKEDKQRYQKDKELLAEIKEYQKQATQIMHDNNVVAGVLIQDDAMIKEHLYNCSQIENLKVVLEYYTKLEDFEMCKEVKQLMDDRAKN